MRSEWSSGVVRRRHRSLEPRREIPQSSRSVSHAEYAGRLAARPGEARGVVEDEGDRRGRHGGANRLRPGLEIRLRGGEPADEVQGEVEACGIDRAATQTATLLHRRRGSGNPIARRGVREKSKEVDVHPASPRNDATRQRIESAGFIAGRALPSRAYE